MTVLARPIEASAMYERVVDRIHRAIHLGQLLPGDKLPPERVLAEQLKVSRVTLREALRVLEGEGYVQTRLGARGSQTVSTPPISTEDMRRRLLSRLDATDSRPRASNQRHAAGVTVDIHACPPFPGFQVRFLQMPSPHKAAQVEALRSEVYLDAGLDSRP